MSINLRVPEREGVHEMKPRIVVVGVGGAGGNAVNDMIASQLEGVEFLAANTDAQALGASKADRKVQIGVNVTGGLGAGAKPDVGREAAEESLSEIMEHLDGANMAFVAAGMGGGTGTGAAPIIARACREKGILTVGVVTKPFQFEGVHRMRLADEGIEELEQYVDTLIVIPNQNLFRIANEKTTFAEAFRMADQVLYSGVRGVTDLMIVPGMINLDFADIRSVMGEMGKAMMGTGEAEGEDRAIQAAQAAIANPLLDDSSMKGAKGVLINITGGDDLTLYEVDEAANRIRSEVDEEAYIIFGSALDDSLQGKIRVSVVATGIDSNAERRPAPMVLRAEKPAPKPAALPKTADASTEPLVPFRAPAAEMPAAEAYAMASDDEAVVEETATVAAVNGDQPQMFGEPADLTTDAAVGSAGVETPESDVTDAENADDAAETTATTDATAEIADEPSDTSATQAPAAMPAKGATDAFIPPKPVAADGREPASPSNPFAVSDMVNGGKGGASTKVTRLPGTRKAGNLLDRIMRKGTEKSQATETEKSVSRDTSASPASPLNNVVGAPSKPAPAAQPLDWPQRETASASRANEPTLSGGGEPPATASTGTDGPQHHIGALDPVDRIPQSKPEEDLLDIPAFLRRQAN
ncbi:MAG: cell division protein FtsZ [Rhodospirillales bacterium]